jgi:hypothetical protein
MGEPELCPFVVLNGTLTAGSPILANRPGGWGWGWTPDPRQVGDGDGDGGFRALGRSLGPGPGSPGAPGARGRGPH